MKCDEVQPILLDYGRGLVSGPETRKLRAQLDKCKNCAALLQEELAFARRLSALPAEQPANDVWALVRARTRPRMIRPLAWLRGLADASAGLKRAVAATAVAAVAAVTIYSFNIQQVDEKEPLPPPSSGVVVTWSDDPLGGHTDALVEFIDKM